MSERFIQYAVAGFFCVMSLGNSLLENWIKAFYFLLAAGFLALWIELHKGDGKTVYKNCSWFMTPPPMPDATK